MENTNLFTIRVRDASPETAYRVTAVRHHELSGGGRVHHRCDDADGGGRQRRSGSRRSTARMRCGPARIGAAAGLAALHCLLVFLYVRTRKTIRHWADDVKKLTNAAFLGNLPEAKIKKRSSVKEQTITICNPKVPDAFKEAVQLIRTRTEDGLIGKSRLPGPCL